MAGGSGIRNEVDVEYHDSDAVETRGAVFLQVQAVQALLCAFAVAVRLCVEAYIMLSWA